ncbi:MAG: ABC transporter permease [Acidimicrobiales bacterium]
MSRQRRVLLVVAPLVFGVAFLSAWELFVVVQHVKPFILPKPSAIWHQIVSNRSLIVEAARVSGANALVGLVAGTAIGLVGAFVASRFRPVQELLSPLAVAVNAVPIIVLVSVFNNMFATTSSIPRRLMVTIVVFFVVFVNVTKGLTNTDQTQLELMSSYAASDWTILRKVRLPNALPFFFTALKVASSLSVITAFVAEYFGGRQNGLGYKITSSFTSSKQAQGWAYVAAACALGLVFYLAAATAERVAIPWETKKSS